MEAQIKLKLEDKNEFPNDLSIMNCLSSHCARILDLDAFANVAIKSDNVGGWKRRQARYEGAM